MRLQSIIPVVLSLHFSSISLATPPTYSSNLALRRNELSDLNNLKRYQLTDTMGLTAKSGAQRMDRRQESSESTTTITVEVEMQGQGQDQGQGQQPSEQTQSEGGGTAQPSGTEPTRLSEGGAAQPSGTASSASRLPTPEECSAAAARVSGTGSPQSQPSGSTAAARGTRPDISPVLRRSSDSLHGRGKFYPIIRKRQEGQGQIPPGCEGILMGMGMGSGENSTNSNGQGTVTASPTASETGSGTGEGSARPSGDGQNQGEGQGQGQAQPSGTGTGSSPPQSSASGSVAAALGTRPDIFPGLRRREQRLMKREGQVSGGMRGFGDSDR